MIEVKVGTITFVIGDYFFIKLIIFEKNKYILTNLRSRQFEKALYVLTL